MPSGLYNESQAERQGCAMGTRHRSRQAAAALPGRYRYAGQEYTVPCCRTRPGLAPNNEGHEQRRRLIMAVLVGRPATATARKRRPWPQRRSRRGSAARASRRTTAPRPRARFAHGLAQRPANPNGQERTLWRAPAGNFGRQCRCAEFSLAPAGMQNYGTSVQGTPSTEADRRNAATLPGCGVSGTGLGIHLLAS